ncbi:MAG: GGDEF domain-containing protein [Oscillospiraceae bacterium]
MEHKKYRCIGICLAMLSESLMSDFVRAAIKRAVEYGYKVLIYNSFTDFYAMTPYEKGEARVYDHIKYELLDGLIIMSESIKCPEITDNILKNARKHNIFTVSVEKKVGCDYHISFNYRRAFETIVRHVLEEHGCKTINLVAGLKNNEFSDERIDCCRKIMSEHGLELDENRIMYGDFWSNPTAAAFDEFMKSGLSMPDAFICCNDSMAITICSKLREAGYRIPDDVIVTGFDGILEEKYHLPRLTTAKQDVELAGEKAVDAITAHLESKDTGDCFLVDHKPVWSHSCGCVPIDSKCSVGETSQLFKMQVDDNQFNTYMFEFNSKAANSNNMSELSAVIHEHSNPFCWHYFGLNLNDDFMNIGSDYESIVSIREDDATEGRLILTEILKDQRFEPYYGKHCSHFEEAMDIINVFLFWSVHFQEKFMGYGIMGLGTGCDDTYPNDEFRHMVTYSRNLNHSLEIANSQAAMKKVIAKLHDLYVRDHTGLYNRRGFYNEIGKFITAARDNPDKSTYLIIISVDMDGLKTINDTYGHAEGDIAIKAIADSLISVWEKNEICSRFGGDEFTVASICTDDPELVGKRLVKRITASLDEYNRTSGKPYKVSCSFGIHYDRIGEDFVVDNLIKIADNLMYKEKATHKQSRCRSAVRS